MIETLINNRWTLHLPQHRAARPEWGQWQDDRGGEHFGWEVERLDSMHKNIGPDDVVYDIGAEEGDLSALYQLWIGTGEGGVVLVEPNPRVWPNIRAIWEANTLRDPLATFTGFAAERTVGDFKVVDLFSWPPEAYGPVIPDHGFLNLSERPDIPTVQIDILATCVKNPTVLTIDVEGAEYHVLRGAETVLKNVKPLVYCSVHPEFMEAMYGEEAQLLYDYLAALGYRTKILAEDHEIHTVSWHPAGRELVF